MNIKKILKESLENYSKTYITDETKKKVYAEGIMINYDKGFMVKPYYKFNLVEEKREEETEEESYKEYDITDLVEIICNTIQKEIEERLSKNKLK